MQQCFFGIVGVRPSLSVVGVQWFVDAFGVQQFLDGFMVQQFSGAVGLSCLIDILNVLVAKPISRLFS